MDTEHWTWSEEHGDYYHVDYDELGKPVYTWSKAPSNTSQQISLSHSENVQNKQPRSPPIHGQSEGPEPQVRGERTDSMLDSHMSMPDPVPHEVRQEIPGLIAGTPNRGWNDALDASYRMRTQREAREFFVQGRVFSLLYSEAASETMAAAKSGTVNTSITIGRFGQGIFSQIRRFVIVKVRRGFVDAIGIFTYGDRGTLKPGCYPAEHAPVYFSGTTPTEYEGERDKGMTKTAIEIQPADSRDEMKPTSRIRFGKTYPIECNVKVKDIGKVAPESMSRLLQYWRDENRTDDYDVPQDTTSDASGQHEHSRSPVSPGYGPGMSAYNIAVSNREPRQHPDNVPRSQDHFKSGYMRSWNHDTFDQPGYQSQPQPGPVGRFSAQGQFHGSHHQRQSYDDQNYHPQLPPNATRRYSNEQHQVPQQGPPQNHPHGYFNDPNQIQQQQQQQQQQHPNTFYNQWQGQHGQYHPGRGW